MKTSILFTMSLLLTSCALICNADETSIDYQNHKIVQDKTEELNKSIRKALQEVSQAIEIGSHKEKITFQYPKITMREQEFSMHIPQYMGIDTHDISWDEPHTTMKLEVIGKYPEVSVERGRVVTRWKEIKAHVPVVESRRREIRIEYPKFQMKKFEWSMGIPEVTLDTQTIVFDVPDVTIHGIDLRKDLANLEELLRQRAATLDKAIRSEFGQLTLKNLKSWLERPDKTMLDALARGESSLRVEIGNGVSYLKSQWWYARIQNHLLAQFMEKPSYTICGEARGGNPVWYVNGMATSKATAIRAGELISEKLGRQVFVIHNATSFARPYDTGLRASGFGTDDLSECVYDRLWPMFAVSRLDTLVNSGVQSLTGSNERIQGNPATRQLAYVLYHSKEPVSLVTHSQGCLIARNALLTTALLGKESEARRNVAWVACGIPLNDNEIWPKPKRFAIVDYDDDPIAKLIGLRGGGLNYNGGDHAITKFVEQFTDDMFFDR